MDSNHPIDCLNFGKSYDTLKREMIRNKDKRVVWKQTDAVDGRYFFGYLQDYSDTTATSLTSKAVVVYPVHAVLASFMNHCCGGRSKMAKLWWGTFQ